MYVILGLVEQPQISANLKTVLEDIWKTVVMLFGCIFNEAWHFLLSKQAEISFVNMKTLNKRDFILNRTKSLMT